MDNTNIHNSYCVIHIYFSYIRTLYIMLCLKGKLQYGQLQILQILIIFNHIYRLLLGFFFIDHPTQVICHIGTVNANPWTIKSKLNCSHVHVWISTVYSLHYKCCCFFIPVFCFYTHLADCVVALAIFINICIWNRL